MGQNNAYVSVVQDTIQKADRIFEAKFLQIDEIHTPVKKQQKNNPPPTKLYSYLLWLCVVDKLHAICVQIGTSEL